MQLGAVSARRDLRAAQESGGSCYGLPSENFSREYRESGGQMH